MHFATPVSTRNLPGILGHVRRQSAHVRGTLHGTMLRNDMFNFARLGTFLERGDNTARILDVKYYILLPSVVHVGAPIDNVQWETILRSVSADHTYNWLNEGEVNPANIARFLILDGRMPRSIAFCCQKMRDNLEYLRKDYGTEMPSLGMAEELCAKLTARDLDAVFEDGLHEFIQEFIDGLGRLGRQIETDYRFSA